MPPLRLTAALCGVATLALSGSALACGGVFCSANNPRPVEQNSERILFEVNGDGTLSMVVEVAWSGDPDDFSWVVPVPGEVSVDPVPDDVLVALDAATTPTLVNVTTMCGDDDWEGGWYCEAGDPTPRAPGAALAEAALATAGALYGCPAADDYGLERELYGDDFPDVDVRALPAVGAYAIDEVSSEDPDALVAWLDANGYVVTDAMEPFIAGYVLAGQRFLALRLAPEAGDAAIAPIRITFAGAWPSIPLVLTSIAAEPEMGILVFVAAEQRYRPTGEWADLEVDPRNVRMDPFSFTSNYFALVLWMADLAGGRAFVTEFAGFTEDVAAVVPGDPRDPDDAAGWVAALAERQPYLTRMYTRVSGWEMTTDPMFVPTASTSLPSALDLSGGPAFDTCFDDVPLCGTTYCGAEGRCATDEPSWNAGCVCAPGSAARSVVEPDLYVADDGTGVVCQRLDWDLLAGGLELSPDLPSPCDGVDCGEGNCTIVGGFPACVCDADMVAIGRPGLPAPVCEPRGTIYEPEELLWPEIGSGADRTPDGFATASRATPPAPALALLPLALPLLIRRRRRRLSGGGSR